MNQRTKQQGTSHSVRSGAQTGDRFAALIRVPCSLVLSALIAVAGCQTESHDSKEPEPQAAESDMGNRVSIPATVRANLGITFVRAEARNVAKTIRVPGRFEPSPEARREYRAMVGGRVELRVVQYQQIQEGDVLFTLDSPHWRLLQERLNETEAQVLQAGSRVDAYQPLMAAHEHHHKELEAVVAIWQERAEELEQMRSSGVVTNEEFARVRAALGTTRAELAEVLEKEAELRSRRVEMEAERNAARERFELLLMNAASLLGGSVEELSTTDPNSAAGHPMWRGIKEIVVRAIAPGVVESVGLTSGSWATDTALVLTTVEPEVLRFRAMGLQSDLIRFSTRATAQIVPPRSAGIQISDSVDADLTLGLEAHPEERTITLIATPSSVTPWMRAGVSAFLEIVVDSSEGKALTIPRSALVRSGLTHVYFRRDPSDPNQAIRIEADIGADDGRWVVINSGLKLGDEVVLDGAYELKIAFDRRGTVQKGGHMHADGTFHGEH